MSSLHLVHPELRGFLKGDVGASLDRTDRKSGQDANIDVQTSGTLNVIREAASIPGLGGAPPIHALTYRPEQEQGTLAAILHIHGGGFIAGSAESYDQINRWFAGVLKCVVVSVDYRLSPATPFPGALEDCYAAIQWLRQNATSLGIDPSRVAVKGESAGGGLAAALAIMMRDRGDPPVAFQCLTYPMLDDRSPVEPNPYVGEFIWTPENNKSAWQAYLGREPGQSGVSNYAAAARTEDFSGLPPTFMAVGTLDLFLEEDLDFARRLLRAAVPVELHVYAGAYHGFQFAGDVEPVRQYFQDCKSALSRALGCGNSAPVAG